MLLLFLYASTSKREGFSYLVFPISKLHWLIEDFSFNTTCTHAANRVSLSLCRGLPLRHRPVIPLIPHTAVISRCPWGLQVI